jgi:hypothetical protein
MAQDGSIQVTIDGDTSDFDAKMEKTGKGIKEAWPLRLARHLPY